MIILIDKPRGISSHDAISAVKKHLRQQYSPDKKIKIGHAGTLDPMATGLLIAATDQDTKCLHHLTHSDKTYITTIDCSRSSDTWDLDYWDEIRDLDPSVYEDIPPQSQIEKIFSSLIGTPLLPLTPFSAKKVDGKKLYEYAREGKTIFLTVPMTIYGYRLLQYSFPLIRVALNVGSGTYIRSIGHWVGTQLGGDAILTELQRTRIGDYSLDDFKQKTIFTAKRDDQDVPYIICDTE